MANRTLDIIIPVKDRSTVLDCVYTLLTEFEQTQEIRLGQILICDGGSQQVPCQSQLRQVTQSPQVSVLAYPHPGFNKGWLLNQGLQSTTAPLVLISDVDILWNAATLDQLGRAAARRPDCVYHVDSVQESHPDTAANQRFRYTYKLSQSVQGQQVKICPVPAAETHRPGYGLLCGQRSLFDHIGGYRHCFQGWGWEDQDLLMRAQLAGYEIAPMGTVVHLSHGDDQRNSMGQRLTIRESRDRNILICLEGLTQGKLLGDLPSTEPDALEHPHLTSQGAIHVHYPTTLAYAANPNHTLSQSPEAPD